MEMGTGKDSAIVLIKSYQCLLKESSQANNSCRRNTFKVFPGKKEMENVKERGSL